MKDRRENVKLKPELVAYARKEATRRGCFIGKIFEEAIACYVMEAARMMKIQRKILAEKP